MFDTSHFRKLRQVLWLSLPFVIAVNVSYGVAATVGPVISTQISDFRISRNEVLPLPPGQWRVRSNTSWGFCEPAKRPNCGDAMGRVVVLENTQSDTPIYSIVVRYTDTPVNNWSLNWCYEPNRDYKDTHKTNNSNAVRKCSRGWDEGLSLSRSTNPSNWYWQGVIDNLPKAAERGSFKTHLEVNLQADNQRSYSIDIFLARDLDGDLLKHEAIMLWKSLFADVAANGLFKGEALVKREILAIGKSSALAHSQVETISGVFDAVSAAERDTKKQLAAQQLFEEQRLAVEERPKQQLAQQQKLEQERLALTKQKDSIAAELAEMRAMLTELKKANKEAPMVEQVAATPPAVEKPVKPAVMARRRALVVGNERYKNVPVLQNAAEDARAMARALTDLGYKVDTYIDLTERGFNRALRDFRADLKGGEEVLFFYAGHGVQLGNSNFLLPTDLGSDSAEQVRDESIELQKILGDLSDQKPKFTLAVIDACRDNPFKQSGRSIGGRGLAPTTAATGQMVMFSAGAGQQALDKLGVKDKDKNGLFTRVFLEEMKRPGVSVDRVLRNVRQRVVDIARSVGHEQVPALYDQAVGEFYFKPN
jgi:hypothetical protein